MKDRLWNLSRIENILLKLPNSWETFFYVFMGFYFVPSLIIGYLLYNDMTENLPFLSATYLSGYIISDANILDFLSGSFVFLIGFLLPLVYWFLIKKDLPVFATREKKKKNIIRSAKITLFKKLPITNLISNFIYLLAILGLLIIGVYFLFAGYDFLSQLGSDASREDFRFTLFSDKNRNLNTILELSRRVFLPLAVSYFFFISYMKRGRLSLRDKMLWTALLFSGIMTLDRGPILLAVALLLTYLFFKSKNIYSAIGTSLLGGAAVVLIGGAVTSIQYNVIDVSMGIIIGQGISLLIDRLFFDPSVMSITNSFALIDGNVDPLLLKFSRISVLWGNAYTGTFSLEGAKYVGPVSMVGDIWRNFGMIGIFVTSFIFSYILMIISNKQNSIIILYYFPSFFLSLILSFYLIVGNLFSLGPIFILLIIFLLTFLTEVVHKKNHKTS
jgi:hypothetical protein